MTDQTLRTPPMPGVIPYIGLHGRGTEAIAFWARAFGAEQVAAMPSQDPAKLMHAHLTVNGGALMISDMSEEGAPVVTPQGFHLQLVVADGQAWWDRAVAAGCEVRVPFQQMFWGDRWGMVADPFGLLWAINEPAGAK